MTLRFQGIAVFLGPFAKPGNPDVAVKNMRTILDKQYELGNSDNSVLYYNHPFEPTTTLLATGKDADNLTTKYGNTLYPDWAPMLKPVNVENMANVTVGDKVKRFASKWLFNPIGQAAGSLFSSTDKMNEILADLARNGNKDAEGKPIHIVRFED